MPTFLPRLCCSTTHADPALMHLLHRSDPGRIPGQRAYSGRAQTRARGGGQGRRKRGGGGELDSCPPELDDDRNKARTNLERPASLARSSVGSKQRHGSQRNRQLEEYRRWLSLAGWEEEFGAHILLAPLPPALDAPASAGGDRSFRFPPDAEVADIGLAQEEE